MRKIERLRLEALESCKFRGHKMERFAHKYIWGFGCGSKCEICGKQVYVTDRPSPNGIEISGEAVALSCEDQIVRCPVCNDPLGINKDGQVLLCAGCNENNH